jgi:hypothetical protein
MHQGRVHLMSQTKRNDGSVIGYFFLSVSQLTQHPVTLPYINDSLPPDCSRFNDDYVVSREVTLQYMGVYHARR